MSTPTNPSAIALMDATQQFKKIVSYRQWMTIQALRQGEEGAFFDEKIIEYGARTQAMPATYEQEEKGDEAIAYLHYFVGGCDWYITEKDVETPDAPGQHQAFGLANLGDEPELGYISIVELLSNGAELDLHWTPIPLSEIKR